MPEEEKKEEEAQEEKKEEPEEKEEKPTEAPASAGKSKIEEAKELLVGMDQKIAELKVVSNRLDEQMAEMALRGKGLAGASQEKTDDQKHIDAANKLLEGSGLNPFPDGKVPK